MTRARTDANANALARAVPQRFEPAVRLSTLHEWPGNPKAHDVPALVALMHRNGRYGVVYVQASTRRMLAGAGRKKAYRKLHVKAVDVVWLDVDDQTAARIVASDNRSVELGGTDDAALAAFLSTQEAAGNLDGTGYTRDDMAELVRAATSLDAPRDVDGAGPAAPPAATTDADQPDEDGATYHVVVVCANRKGQRSLLSELKGRGLACRGRTVRSREP
jgi:hypothetical protein